MLSVAITASMWGATAYMGYSSAKLGQSYMRSLRGRDSTSWPTASGEIIRPLNLRSSRYHNIFNIEDVKYAYYLKGKKFYGDRLRFNDNCLRVSENLDSEQAIQVAQRIVDQFQRGKSIKVPYNPRRSSESVLMPGGDEYYIRYLRNDFFISLGLLVVFFALSIIIQAVFQQIEEEHKGNEEIERKKAELVRLEQMLKEKDHSPREK